MQHNQNTSCYSKRSIVIGSPLIIITTNFLSAYFFGALIGKWVFIPIILIEWCWFIFFIARFGGRISIKLWLRKPDHNSIWTVFAVILGLVPFPIFLLHKGLLAEWTVWLPWIILAIVNPWLEEFYWRGLLLDNISRWNKWIAILFSSLLFAANHAVFGIYSELMRGPEIFVSTLVMGIVWAVTYKKTGSLRWVLIAHFLVDFFNLSVPSFLDLYQPGR